MYAIFTLKWGLKDILFLDPYGRLTPHGGGNVHFIFLSASWKKCSCHGKAGGIYKRGERDSCIAKEFYVRNVSKIRKQTTSRDVVFYFCQK